MYKRQEYGSRSCLGESEFLISRTVHKKGYMVKHTDRYYPRALYQVLISIDLVDVGTVKRILILWYTRELNPGPVA